MPNNTFAKKKGRVIYLEPTDFPEYKITENGSISKGVTLDNISWNQEDLQFNVDLRVINPDRIGSRLPIFQNTNNVVESKFTSFMSGKDFNDDSNYLTDSYSDITFQEVSAKGESQKEALGIDSIDISFDSHFFPLVNIKFTDVRAAALFGPTDNEYVHNKRIEAIINDKSLSEEKKREKISEERGKMSSSFFKSLFHFPYPRFMLSVMGYYGERVTFQLAVNDFKTSFNSSNGNFDVNVSFIGYMYGLYTDLPMSLIFTAPYYDHDYWIKETQSEKGRFKYTDGQPILTFIEYLKAYYELKKEDNEEGINGSNILKIYKKLTDAKNSLEDILTMFEVFNAQFTTNTTNMKVYHKYNDENPKVFLLFSTEERHDLTISKFNRLSDSVLTYNQNYAQSDKDKLNLDDFYAQQLTGDYFKFNLKVNTSNNKELSHTNKPEIDEVIDELNGIKSEIPGLKTKEGVYTLPNYFIYYIGDFKDEVEKRIEVLTKEIESRRKDADDEMINIISKKLSFKPTIENVFRMIFAHIDTFIHSIKTTAIDNIISSIANNSEERRSSFLGLTSKNSDIPKYYTEESTIPPFPLCKEEKTGEYQYPGVFYNGVNNNVNYIDEVKFVEKVVEGIKVFNNDVNLANTLLESLSSEEDRTFDSVSISDILYKNENPYFLLRDKLEGVAQTDQEKAQYIEYFIFARLIMYAITNCITDKELKDKIEELIKLEFENFKKANISISKNTKAYLMNNAMQYRVNSEELTYSKIKYEQKKYFKFKSNNCYFFNDAFNKNNAGNKYANSEATVLTILDDSYDNIISAYEEKNGTEIDTKNTILTRESWLKNGSKDEYTMSYITSSSEDKSSIGFAGDYYKKDWLFTQMSDDYNKYGDSILNNYNAGILQIGDNRAIYNDGNVEKNYDKEYKIDDIYLGVNTARKADSYSNKKDKPLMSVEENKYFRAFLLLGSLSTYFNLDNYYSLNTYYEVPASLAMPLQLFNKKAKMFKHPKALLLYYGACVYFRKNNHEKLNDTTIYKESFSLVNLSSYTTDNGCTTFDDENKVWKLKTFTNKEKNLFLCKGTSKDCAEIRVSNGTLDDLERYFINWVDSGEFKQIDDVLSNDDESECPKMTNYDQSYHKNKEITFTIRPASSRQDLVIKRLLCDDAYIFKRPEGLSSLNETYSYSKEYLESIKNAFSDYKTEEDIKEEERKEQDKKVNDVSDVKKALYYTLKRLYDKWLCCYNLDGKDNIHEKFKLDSPSNEKNKKKARYTTNSDNNASTEFNSFIFVDSFYRDISDKFLVDPDSLKQLAESYSNAEIMNSNASVFEFMNEIAQKNGLLFASLPIYSNFYDVDNIVNIFSPNKKYDVSSLGKSDVPGNTYVIMYTGEASSKLDFGQEGEYDDDGITDLAEMFKDQLPTSPSSLQELIKEAEGDELNFIVPVFAVTFGKQNQMYFKNITVNMDNPKVTDYSIANLIQISYGGAHGDTDGYDVGIGQDLYSIYANRSYTCTVEMLGCINIMPMMYFQLNNIPMFRGLYIIINVSHNIKPGNMTTKFTGVRVSKNHIGLVKTTFTYQGQYDKINADDISVNVTNDSVSVSCKDFIDENIGKHFMLSDFTIKSSTAKEYNICNIPIPGEDWIDLEELKKRLNEIANEILDPLWDAWVKEGAEDGFNLTSGFRSQRTTRKSNSKPTTEKKSSAHTYGFAVDIQSRETKNRGRFKKFVYFWLKNNNKKIDQFIDEQSSGNNKSVARVENGGWVHIGFKRNNGEQRGEFKWTKNASSSDVTYKWLTDEFYS